MKRNPVVIPALLVFVMLILAVGSLYVNTLAAGSAPGSVAAVGTEPYAANLEAQADMLYMPLAVYDLPPAPPGSTPTPTPTTTPTVTNTPTQLPNTMVINYIEPGDRDEEYVRVKNRTNERVDLTDWSIRAEESSKKYTFPDGFYLESNDAVRVWTKAGYNQGMDLYWGLSTEVWDDDDDCGRLRDDRDDLVHLYCYSSGTPEPPTTTPEPIPDVIINHIENGTSDLDYYQEYVRVKNRTLSTVQMKGWTIKSDSTKLRYTFPDFKLKPNAAVRVWTQHGTDGAEDLYWGAGEPMWDNDEDCARLGNDDDDLVQWYCYP
jgi:hypothetical protein